MRIQGLRCLDEVNLGLFPGLQIFAGANGAGKTSILEAAYLLSHGRSFRAGTREVLMKRGGSALSIYAELQHGDGRVSRLGLGRSGSRWEARMDGESIALGQLVRECAVVCFEPGSHALIAGAAEERRRFLDWGVFHVEHDFLVTWQRYQRALKQRNSLLRSEGLVPDEWLQPWERELGTAGELIHGYRQLYLDALRPHLEHEAQRLLPELGRVELRYRPGWAEGNRLEDELAGHRGRDRARGHTTVGSHRADWSVSFEHAPQREHLSRGQEKLTALACLLAQAALYADRRGEWPIVCLDDLASELDLEHQAALVEQLAQVQAQVLITGTEVPAALNACPAHMFHVEQGRVAPLL